MLSQRHVEYHHDQKPAHDAEGADVAVLAQMRLRNELLDDDIHHGARGKREHPGHIWRDKRGEQAP